MRNVGYNGNSQGLGGGTFIIRGFDGVATLRDGFKQYGVGAGNAQPVTIAWKVGDKTDLSVSAEYIDSTRPTDFGLPVIGTSVANAKVAADLDPTLVGQKLFGVPDHAASFWATYELQQGEMKGLGFGAGLNFRGVGFQHFGGWERH